MNSHQSVFLGFKSSYFCEVSRKLIIQKKLPKFSSVSANIDGHGLAQLYCSPGSAALQQN